ncbi:hypothetical protein HDU91_006403 [Kappamyces sp. JEL0680]|nr:hypothetical protein HDU91_006403 [Kappamyces sp. JEL0680]
MVLMEFVGKVSVYTASNFTTLPVGASWDAFLLYILTNISLYREHVLPLLILCSNSKDYLSNVLSKEESLSQPVMQTIGGLDNFIWTILGTLFDQVVSTNDVTNLSESYQRCFFETDLSLRDKLPVELTTVAEWGRSQLNVPVSGNQLGSTFMGEIKMLGAKMRAGDLACILEQNASTADPCDPCSRNTQSKMLLDMLLQTRHENTELASTIVMSQFHNFQLYCDLDLFGRLWLYPNELDAVPAHNKTLEPATMTYSSDSALGHAQQQKDRFKWDDFKPFCPAKVDKADLLLYLNISGYKMLTLLAKQGWVWTLIFKRLQALVDLKAKIPLDLFDGLCVAGISYWKHQKNIPTLEQTGHVESTINLFVALFQVSRYFSQQDSFGGKLSHAFWDGNSTTRAAELKDHFDLLGMDTSLQHFSLSRDDVEWTGANVHGILRSPRADGTESILLVAPQRCGTGGDNNNGVNILLSFAAFAKRFSFWSKDIIFLITDQDHVGTLSWLKAYHGMEGRLPGQPSVWVTTGHSFDRLENHGGSIISVLNLEFEGSDPYTSVGVHPIGINGRLANADLTTTAVKSLQYSGVPMVLLHKGRRSQSHLPWIDNYPILFSNLLAFIKAQALGFPLTNHGLFALFNIEALSLTGNRTPGQGLETACRSLNNLLERFHHAYWFYLMPEADKFIPLSKYIGQIIAVISAAVLSSVRYWWTSGDLDFAKPSKLAAEKPAFMRRQFAVASFSTRIRPLYMPLLSLSFCCLLPAWTFSNMGSLGYLSNENPLFGAMALFGVFIAQQVMAWFMMPLLQRLFCGDSGASKLVVAPAWEVLHSLTCALLGMLLLVLATTNPSLALIMALPSVPIFILVRPRNSTFAWVVQSVLLMAISPPVVLGMYAIYEQDIRAATAFLYNTFQYWELYGGLILPVVCLFYWPLNLATQLLITMEL